MDAWSRNIMGILRRGPKEDKEGDMIRDVVVNQQQGQAQTTDMDYLQSLGRTVYMIMDTDVTDFLKGPIDPKTGEMLGSLSDLIPAFSHMNRLTKIGKGEAELLKLQYDYLILRKRMSIPEHEYDGKAGGALEALRIYGLNMVNDCVDGFKAKIATEQIKITKVELEKKKRGVLG